MQDILRRMLHKLLIYLLFSHRKERFAEQDTSFHLNSVFSSASAHRPSPLGSPLAQLVLTSSLPLLVIQTWLPEFVASIHTLLVQRPETKWLSSSLSTSTKWAPIEVQWSLALLQSSFSSTRRYKEFSLLTQSSIKRYSKSKGYHKSKLLLIGNFFWH